MATVEGKSFLVVADTPWAIPFRATLDQVAEYAEDRLCIKFKGLQCPLPRLTIIK